MNQTVLNTAIMRVKNTLENKGLSCEIKQFSDSTRTASEAAEAIGCEIAQIVKSLLFKTKESNQPILILASGKNRVNERTIAAIVGEEIIKADADFTREVTGYAIGGVPPLGNSKINMIYIDQALFAYEMVWAAAGTPFAVFNLKPRELQNLTNGKMVAIN